MASRTSKSMRLVRNGFVKPSLEGMYKFDPKKNQYVIADPKLGQPSESHAHEELAEEANIRLAGTFVKTGYPATPKRHRFIYETFNLGMEEVYFWFLNHLKQDWGFPYVEKLTDTFSASENSAFFGQSAQRLSIQEDRASSFLRGISELVKQLFQIVRELRIIDERLEPYHDWMKRMPDGKVIKSKAADSTLKGVFSDFAENKGGQMQPGSIYHLAQTVGYAALPDLFFNTHVYNEKEVDKVVDSMTNFNKNVKTVLKRKLYQFLVWREKTYDELVNRKRFQIRYLRQHWATIKMYMSWTKPYLRHIKRLSMNEEQLDAPELISAFETSMTEVELLFRKPDMKGYFPCILATFQFQTRPLMQYRQEYQQGPVHVGRITITLRSYGWRQRDIDNYKRLREDEDKELLSLVDDSVQAAMEALGDDLEKYLNDASMGVFDNEVHEKYGKGDAPKSVAKPKMKSLDSAPMYEPIVAVFGGLWDIAKAFVPVSSGSSKKKKPSGEAPYNKKLMMDAAKSTAKAAWQVSKNYRKATGLLSW